MLGVVPAAGLGSRLQPLACSKELLPLAPPGGPEWAPRAVIEFILDRLQAAGADRICVVIAAEKTDLVRYLARGPFAARLLFVVQPEAAGLCDALFRAAPHQCGEEAVLLGLPDTVWHPRQALAGRPVADIHLVTFPVEHPEHFDAVIPLPPGGERGLVRRVEVKQPGDRRRRVWGAVRMAGPSFASLHRLWLARGGAEPYLGDLLNAWIGDGGQVGYDCAGSCYMDIGTPEGYAAALAARIWEEPAPRAEPQLTAY